MRGTSFTISYHWLFRPFIDLESIDDKDDGQLFLSLHLFHFYLYCKILFRVPSNGIKARESFSSCPFNFVLHSIEHFVWCLLESSSLSSSSSSVSFPEKKCICICTYWRRTLFDAAIFACPVCTSHLPYILLRWLIVFFPSWLEIYCLSLHQLLFLSRISHCFSFCFLLHSLFLQTEINRVRSSLFQISGSEKKPLKLPEPEGPVICKSDKIYVPIDKHPEYNFVGRILGPRGMTAKQLEHETGCKIMVRGKGSMRDRKKEEQNRGKPNWEHLNEPLHVLITCEDTLERADIKLMRAREEVEKLLVPVVSLVLLLRLWFACLFSHTFMTLLFLLLLKTTLVSGILSLLLFLLYWLLLHFHSLLTFS